MLYVQRYKHYFLSPVLLKTLISDTRLNNLNEEVLTSTKNQYEAVLTTVLYHLSMF